MRLRPLALLLVAVASGAVVGPSRAQPNAEAAASVAVVTDEWRRIVACS